MPYLSKIKARNLTNHLNGWSLISLLAILLVIIPNTTVFLGLFTPANENWSHIREYLLQSYITNTLVLAVATGTFASLIGISLAWLTSVYDFFGRRVYEWALILPLALPAYIAAYTYEGIFNYTGVIQSFFRNSLGVRLNPAHFDMMSRQGAIFVFTIVLFPYVFITTRAFLVKQSASMIEAARVLGRKPWEIFLYVIIPLARGAIIGGASLVVLEVLNDYGVVKYYGVPAFSTAIFQTWFGMGDVDSAIKLASILMLFVFAVLALEKVLRGRQKVSFSSTQVRPIKRVLLSGWQGAFASLYCLLVFALGFLIPTAQLVHWSLMSYHKVLDFAFFTLVANSLIMALGASAIVVVVATIIANTVRISDSLMSGIYSRLAVLGYSIPGAVIAVGMIVFFLRLDTLLAPITGLFFANPNSLVLSTSIVMLLVAYVIRFLAIGYNPIDSGFDKVGKGFFEASRTLGMTVTETFFKVDLPMIRPALYGGFILVFMDILKELPLTLILRPFNFDTLATKAFEYANDEMIQEASISSLIIILISVIAVYFFFKVGRERR